MQITCCYDDCSCSVTAFHTHANLNISGLTSTVKFEPARCVLKTNTTSITSSRAQTQTNVNVAPIIILITNSCVRSGHTAFPCPYQYLPHPHHALALVSHISNVTGQPPVSEHPPKPSLCTKQQRHFHPNPSGWSPPPPPPLLPPPAHHRQTPAAGRLPNLTPLSTHWG